LTRTTSSIHIAAPAQAAGVSPVKLLEANPFRVMYSIQNLDATNFIAVAAHSHVTAGTYSGSEGQHITAGQSVSDTDDKGQVYAIADTGACNVAILEVSEPTAGGAVE